MGNRKKHTIALILIGIVVLVLSIVFKIRATKRDPVPPQYRLELIEHWATAWSYEVYSGDLLLIKQEFVPGVPGTRHFTSKEEAHTIGTLVVDRLSAGKSPVIHAEDLKNNGISH